MKIVKQTDSYLMLRQNPIGGCFLLIWASLFAGAPLFVMIGMIRQAGVNQLSCQRVESAQVNCQLSHSRWFGLSSGPVTSVKQIQVAQLNSETRSDEDGDYEVYRMSVTTPQGNVAVTDFNTDYLTQNNGVAQLNQFVQSPAASELKLVQDDRWQFNRTIAPILFLSLFVLIGGAVLYGTLQVKSLILDKTLNRLTYRRQTLLGTKQYDYPLGVVQEIQLKEHTDSYGNKSYEPILLPDVVKRITFTAISNRQQALQLQEQIRQFLNLRIQPEATPSLATEATPVYQNNRTYTSSGLTTVPATATTQVQTIDRQLLHLGFIFVGDLKPSNFPTATLYSYVQSSKDIYAVITEAGANQTPFVSLDFGTHFFNGTMLVTTSSKLCFNHLKSQKLLRWSHPGLEPSLLYQQHQQYFSQLQMEVGRAHRTQAELTPIAALIDDYFTRQTNGFLLTAAAILNAIAMAFQAQKPAKK